MNLHVGRQNEKVKDVFDCIARPVPGPNLFGLFDSNIVFGIPKGFGHNAPSFGIIIMGTLLLVLAYRVLSHRAERVASTSRFIGLYIGITGLFFFSLFTNLNIIVVVMAGMHNLLEWGIITSLLATEFYQRRYFAFSVIWIWVVWLIVMQIPDLFVAFGFEEVAGLWPDWVLLMYSYHLARLNGGPYNFFFEGALWHMVQIFTLLLQGFGKLEPHNAMIASYVSALPNYWYYSEFAIHLVDPHAPTWMFTVLSPFFLPRHERSAEGDDSGEDDVLLTDVEHVPPPRQPSNGRQLLFRGLLFSSLCVAGPPLLFGKISVNYFTCHRC
jgi:hypothetical protein